MARLQVRIFPNAGRRCLEFHENGECRIYVTASATDGKANRDVIALVSELATIPKSRISIVRGLVSRHKVLECGGLDSDELQRRLESGATRRAGPVTVQRLASKASRSNG